MRIHSKALTLLAASLYASLTPVTAVAQQQEAAKPVLLEELLVTAQKREQNLQDVAVGVSLLTGKALAESQLRNASELATLIPTLNLQASSDPSTSSFNIRGIGTRTFSPGVEPSVSTMLDGVVMGRSGMAFMELVDIDRIEVLRGPQGTLYGKNASGGVVHIITRDPTPELTATVVATAIEHDEYRLDGTVSGPITDDLSYRITGSAVNDDGYAENFYNGNKVNDANNYSARGKLLWQANEDLEFLLSADYTKNDCDCTALSVRSILESPAQQEELEKQLPVVPSKDNKDVNNDETTFSNIRSHGFSLTANWDVRNHLLTSITAYREWESESFTDLDRTPGNPLALTLPEPPNTHQNQFSQELRITSPPASWGTYVLGAFYFDQDVDTANTATTSLLEPFLPAVTRVSRTDVHSKNAALFGEVNFSIAQDWQLTLGGRYTYDELKYDTTADGTGIIFPPDGTYSDSLDDSDFSPKIALQWDITDNAMTYVSYVSGYKGPAFDTGLVAGGTVVDPETSDAYEVGVKSSWFDNRLVFNVAVFYTEYDDFQAETAFDIPESPIPANIVTNVGQVSTQGIEVEFLSQPTDKWTIGGGIAYTDGTIDDYPDGNCSGGQKFRGECGPDGTQDLSGGQLPFTPEWKLNLSTDYTIDMESAPFAILLGANVRAQDDVLYELSQDKYTWQDAYGIVDIRAAIAGKRHRYRITAFVKNLFDKNYASLIFAQPPELIPNAYIQAVSKYAERTAGVELRYEF